MRKVFIYGLIDPRNQQLRYVGKTYDMQRRLWQHFSRPKNSYIGSWIKNLKSEGLRPEIFCLEEFDFYEVLSWQESERFWIETLRFHGARLTNLMTGGIGGMCHSPETKLRISKKVNGRKMPPEHGAKISAAKKGQKYIFNPLRKRRAWTDAQRQELSNRQKGVKLSESHKASLRIGWAKKREAYAKN